MKSGPVFLTFLFFALFQYPLFPQSESDQLDAMIRQGMEDWKIPGLVATVVKDGEVVFGKAYGVRDLEDSTPVDPNTLFNMGSTTKAMIAMALGILVDRDKIHWEDKVYRYLPYFRLSDPYIREEARIQDLLTHNLGISEADLLWVLDSTSTRETLQRFALADKAYPVRGGFEYNNLMYAVAGEVIKSASGKHWTEFVEEEIFAPLEMNRTVAKVAEVFPSGNYVTPYLDDPEAGMLRATYNRSDQIGAAGMIWTCLSDIQHYLEMLTQKGTYKDKTLLSPDTFAYLFEPHAFVDREDFYPTQQLTNPNWRTYGLGWFQHDYRGHKLDFHTGSISGLVAIAGIMHDENTAVYVLANLDHAELRHAILYKAMDLWALGDPQRDWHKETWDLYSGLREAAAAQERDLAEKRIPDTRPTLPVSAYEGNYTHPMLGTVRASRKGDGLELDFNGYARFQLHHWHYDTFRSDRDNRYLTRILVQFSLGTNGKPEKLSVFGSEFTKTDP